MLREHQLVALILSLHDSFSSSKGKLAPPASFTRPHARRPPFSMGMIACPSLVARLLAQREGDVALAPAALIAAMAARAAISSVDVRRETTPTPRRCEARATDWRDHSPSWSRCRSSDGRSSAMPAEGVGGKAIIFPR